MKLTGNTIFITGGAFTLPDKQGVPAGSEFRVLYTAAVGC